MNYRFLVSPVTFQAMVDRKIIEPDGTMTPEGQEALVAAEDKRLSENGWMDVAIRYLMGSER